MFTKSMEITVRNRAIRSILFFLFCFPLAVAAQDLDQRITVSFQETPLRDVLTLFETKYNVPFAYSIPLVDKKAPVTLESTDRPMKAVMEDILETAGLGYKIVGNNIVLKPAERIKPGDSGWVVPGAGGGLYTISGFIRDSQSGEELIGATVRLLGRSVGTTANPYGFYSIQLPEGSYDLEVSYLGFQPTRQKLDLKGNQKLDWPLISASSELTEVEVTANSDDDPWNNSRKMGHLPMRQVEELPSLLGRKDIIEGVQTQPGIQRKTEGTTGFHVRGGAVDHNLILLDEAPVYNEAHFLGFLSVFNWNTIKSAEFYKSGIPAQYGGRLASVLDIRLKEGHMNKYSGSGEVTPLYAQATVEGPIVKDKASFLVSGRRSVIDFFLSGEADADSEFNITDFFFYDTYGKTNIRLGDKDRLYLSGYLGEDVFRGSDDFDIDQRWGNNTGTLRWNHLFSDKLFTNVSAIYSEYNYLNSEEFEDEFYFFSLSIRDWTGKADAYYYPNANHSVRFGAQWTNHQFRPGEEEFSGPDTATINFLPNQQAHELGLYLGDEWSFAPAWKLYAGLRWSGFYNYGETIVNRFDGNGQLISADSNLSGIYQRNGGLEPRLNLSYNPRGAHLFSLTYDLHRQYLHLATNTVAKAPTDLWVPTTNTIRPQISQQVSLSYFNSLPKGWQVGTAVYYKNMENAIDFRDRANLVLNNLIESEIRQGNAQSMGWEVQVEKSTGPLTGAVNYTLSRTIMEVDDINNGLDYTAAHDRPHNLNTRLAYEFHPRWKATLNFVLASGLPANFPVASYALQGQEFTVFGERNSDRLPTYHRLDAGIRWLPNPAHRWKSEWELAVYNVYNRFNAYQIIVSEDQNVAANTAQKYYVFPIMPTLSYRFKF